MAGPSQQSVWAKLSYTLPNSLESVESAVTTVDVKSPQFTIGRAIGCDLQIGLKVISGRHCYLEKGANSRKAFLVDSSTNGTFVNAQKVSNGQKRELSDGDKLYLVRKKVNPNQDFYIIFRFYHEETKAGSNQTWENPSPAKRFKSEESEDAENLSLRIVSVKSEFTVSEEEEEHEETFPQVVAGGISSPEEQSTKEEETSVDGTVSQERNVAAQGSGTRASNLENMEEMFKCSLCLEILYDPVCIQPCMHCYCSGCYSEWMAFSQNCPQCRCAVQRLARNHMISSLLEVFLKSNPDKRRSQAEIEKLDSKNSVTKEMLRMSSSPSLPAHDRLQSQCPLGCDCDQCLARSESSSDSELDSPHPVFGNPLVLSVCEQCPVNSLSQSKSSDCSNDESKPGCSTSKEPVVKELSSKAAFVCGPNQAHIICSCCLKRMPDLTAEPAPVKPQKCSLCHKVFCHMYLGCTKLGCPGCLNTFSDLVFSQQDLSNFINNNIVETRILMDYEETQGRSAKETIRSCLDCLDSGVYVLPVNIKSNSVLCHTCGLFNLKSLAYDYRSHIPSNSFPVGVTSRPDCYWGVNCRTQKHNMSHAQRYNHICNQTRF